MNNYTKSTMSKEMNQFLKEYKLQLILYEADNMYR